MIEFRCHQCGAKLASPQSEAGQLDSCPRCNTQCRVPLPPIRYKCPNCRATLESPGEHGGGQDVCPACGKACQIPLNNLQRQAEKQRRKDEGLRRRQRQAEVRQAEERRDEALRHEAAAARQREKEAETARWAEEQRIMAEDQRRQQEGAERDEQVAAAAIPVAQPRKRKKGMWIAGGVVALIVIIIIYIATGSDSVHDIASGLYTSEVQDKMDQVIRDDNRNSGVEVEIHHGSLWDSSVLIFDLQRIPGDKSKLDVFRIFVQFAEEMQHKDFNEVQLACRGTVKFKVRGDYFQKLGREYSFQNPNYTLRTFPENLLTPEGLRAYPEWGGGMIGVLNAQMKDFNDFHHKWYLDDMISYGQ